MAGSCSLVADERRSTFKEHCYQGGALRNTVRSLIGGLHKASSEVQPEGSKGTTPKPDKDVYAWQMPTAFLKDVLLRVGLEQEVLACLYGKYREGEGRCLV